MPGIVGHPFPTDHIFTIAAFASAHGLTADITENRDGTWYAKINAYTSAYVDATLQRTIPRQLIVTKNVKTELLAQTELAKQLTALNTIELSDGTKVDISTIRVTPGDAA